MSKFTRRHLGPVLLAVAIVLPAFGADEPKPYQCRKIAAGSIVIDGKMNESVWAKLPALELANIKDGSRPKVTSTFRFAWTDQALYFFAVMEDDKIIATITERDGDLWREDAIELFVNPVPGRLLPYVEFEVSPRGVFYDILVLDPRKCLSRRYEEPWKRNFTPPGVVAKAEIVKGKRTIWQVEMKIPLSAFTLTQQVPLKAGHRWRVGVYRID